MLKRVWHREQQDIHKILPKDSYLTESAIFNCGLQLIIETLICESRKRNGNELEQSTKLISTRLEFQSASEVFQQFRDVVEGIEARGTAEMRRNDDVGELDQRIVG